MYDIVLDGQYMCTVKYSKTVIIGNNKIGITIK